MLHEPHRIPHPAQPPRGSQRTRVRQSSWARAIDASGVRERCAGQGEIVAKTIRALIDQDRAPTGNWTSGRCSKHCDPKKRPRDQHGPHNVHMAGQLTLLMDMFLADTLPRLDYVGVVEQFDASWNGTLRAYQQYNDLHGVKVDPERYTPKPIEARGRHRGHDEEEMWAVLRHDPQLLCDAAHMLEFDYECLPTYNLSRWCDGNASHAVPA
jgi:hypothetical protein